MRIGIQVLIRRRDVLVVISRSKNRDLIVYDSHRISLRDRPGTATNRYYYAQ
jgi:hypothetical protein